MSRGKYDALLDPATRAYVDLVDRWYPPETNGLPIEKQRAIYNGMCRSFHLGYPDGVEARDAAIDAGTHSIPIRTYRRDDAPARAMLVYYHGGGFILGGLDSHDDVCAEICAGAGCDVLSVAYRLAPEHLHPAQFDDAMTAFRWAAANSALPLLVSGESAGGNLAAAVAHATRTADRRPAGQVLIYPDLGGDVSSGSYVEHGQAPMATVRDLEFYRGVRTGEAPPSDDPTLSPLRGSDYSGLPPTVIVTAECDPLSSDGETYRDRIVAAGGKACWIEEPRLTHSFVRARAADPRAKKAFADIVAAVAALAKGEWPY